MHNIDVGFWLWLKACMLSQMQGRYKEIVGSQVSLNKLDNSTKAKKESPCAC